MHGQKNIKLHLMAYGLKSNCQTLPITDKI